MRTTHIERKPLSGNLLVLLLIVSLNLVATVAVAQEAVEVEADQQPAQFQPIRTDSPRQTLETLLRLHDEFNEAAVLSFEDEHRQVAFERTRLIGEQARALLDLSSVPPGSRREVSTSTSLFLFDIFGRIEVPDLDSVPDVDDLELPTTWRVLGTPLRIVRVSEGNREGEYLFSAQTIKDAPRFFRGIESIPLRSSVGIRSWSEALPQLTGPVIPVGFQQSIPQGLKRVWLDTPVWKIIAVTLLLSISILSIRLLYRIATAGSASTKSMTLLRSATVPAVGLIIIQTVNYFVAYQIFIFGAFSRGVGNLLTIANYLAITWLFWLSVRFLFELAIDYRNLQRDDFNTQLFLLGGRAIAFIGSIAILGTGAQTLGFPIYSIVAGLGIGGLAVALAIRPTLENLIGGIILYLDHPVRVGDYCSFDDKRGTVERVGIRSTKVRALDRTMITIPNAALVDMQLINWAYCDQMLITTTISLRYETETDQLRYVLVKLREMLHAHPKIDKETVRVRFAGYGSSSLDISVRVYALTRDWNPFYAIREDVFLRIKDIVQNSGTDFAFPAQTLYMARDGGIDLDQGRAAASEIRAMRESGDLPFPRMSAERIAELKDTLDWPPVGSVDVDTAGPKADEPLSTDDEIRRRPDD